MAAKHASGRNPSQGRSRVPRAPKPATEKRNPGAVNSQAAVSRQAKAKPGQQAPATPTTGSGAPIPAAGPSQSSVRSVSGRGVRDQSSAATGTSIFGKADAGNRRLGRRNRS
jgi:hypothetical protein